MEKIVVTVNPFSTNIPITVFTNNNKEIVFSNYENLAETIYKLCTKFNIEEIELYGNDNFNQKIKDNIFLLSASKNNFLNITVELKGEF